MVVKYNGLEKRKADRVKVNFVAICRLRRSLNVTMASGDEDVYATILDLSESGMALLANRDVPIDSEFLVKFVLVNIFGYEGERFHLIEVQGQVCYSVPSLDNKYRVGIVFKQIPQDKKSAISSFIASSMKNV